MKPRNIRKYWLNDFKSHLLESTYWGKVAHVAHLMLASALIKSLTTQGRIRRTSQRYRFLANLVVSSIILVIA